MILYKALVHSDPIIWNPQESSSSSKSIHISRHRSSLLLSPQTVFRRAHLNRRSAVKLFANSRKTPTGSLENVPVNWEDLREAAKQIIGQAALDQDTFVKFKFRLEKLFKES